MNQSSIFNEPLGVTLHLGEQRRRVGDPTARKVFCAALNKHAHLCEQQKRLRVVIWAVEVAESKTTKPVDLSWHTIPQVPLSGWFAEDAPLILEEAPIPKKTAAA